MENSLSKIAEDASSTVGKAWEESISKLSAQVLRPMHKQALLCSLKCFDKPLQDADQDQMCLDACNFTLKQAEAMIMGEASRLQERVARSYYDCQYDNRNKHGEGLDMPALKVCFEKSTAQNVESVGLVAKRLEQEIQKLASKQE
jgi:hypothetical protein